MSNKEIAQQWFEDVWNHREAAAIDRQRTDDMLSRGFRAQSPATGGGAGCPAFYRAFMNGFPDLHITIEDVVEEGDRVAVRWRATGTLTGEGFGVPPTGKRMDTGGQTILHLHNGRIAEAWNNFDFFGMHRQLGTLSSVASGGLTLG